MRKEIEKMQLIGVLMTGLAFIFAIIETKYFGSNWLPKSKEELFCDYISAYLSGAGVSLLLYGKYLESKL